MQVLEARRTWTASDEHKAGRGAWCEPGERASDGKPECWHDRELQGGAENDAARPVRRGSDILRAKREAHARHAAAHASKRGSAGFVRARGCDADGSRAPSRGLDVQGADAQPVDHPRQAWGYGGVAVMQA